MKNITMIVLAIAIVSLAVYGEDYLMKGFIMIYGMTLFCIGLLFESISNRFDWDDVWHKFITMMGCILYFSSYLTITMTLHFVHTKDSIAVKSPFYTHDLESGQRVETRSLRSYYKQYYSRFYFDVQKFYFLYHGKSCSVYNEYRKIIELPDSTFSVEVKDFGHGELDYIKCGEDSFDLRGTQISDGYKPYIRDVTPDDTNYSNL